MKPSQDRRLARLYNLRNMPGMSQEGRTLALDLISGLLFRHSQRASRAIVELNRATLPQRTVKVIK